MTIKTIVGLALCGFGTLAEQVVRYLTRYLTGGPISDGRITAADAKELTFLAREGTRTGGERQQVPVTLTTTEFIRRWCEHIQPDQLTKTRTIFAQRLFVNGSFVTAKLEPNDVDAVVWLPGDFTERVQRAGSAWRFQGCRTGNDVAYQTSRGDFCGRRSP